MRIDVSPPAWIGVFVLLIACDNGPRRIADFGFGECLAGPALSAAVAEVARCSEDVECTIRPIDVCGVQGLGCYWVALSARRSQRPLEDALRRYHEVEGASCPMTSCDCDTPPQAARCIDRRCQAVRENGSPWR